MDEQDDFEAMLAEAESFDGGLEDPSADPDNVTTSVISDMSVATRENIAPSKLFKSIAKSAVMSVPGDIGESASGVADVLSETMDSASTNLDKVRKNVANTVGGVAEVAPESFKGTLNRIQQWLYEKDDYNGSSRGPSEDERISSEISTLLNVDKTKTTIQDDDNIKELQTETTNTLLARLVSSNDKLLKSKFDVDYKYYQKDLELQTKQTLTLISMYGIMNRDSEIRTKQLEAIVKNTGLPDFAKNRLSDVAKRMMHDGITDVGLNAFQNSDIFQQTSKNLQNFVSEISGKVLESTGMIDSMVDMKRMQQDMGMSSQSILMDTLAKKGISKVTDFGTEKIIKSMLSNEDGQTALADLDKALADPKRTLEKLQTTAEESNPGSLKSKALSMLSESVGSNLKSKTYDISDGTNLNEATAYTSRSQTVNDVVVPDLLSKILAEVTTIRKGATTVSDKDILSFDHVTGTFTNQKDLMSSTEKTLSEKGSTLAKAVTDSDLISLLTNGADLANEDKKSLGIGLIKYLSAGKSTSPYTLVEDGLLDFIPNPNVRSTVKYSLDTLSNPTTEDDYKKIQELKGKLNTIQTTNISNYSDVTSRIKKTTNTTLLSKLGISDKNEPGKVTSNTIKDTNTNYAIDALDSLPGFKTGGFSGDGATNEVAGVIHGSEYTINNQKLKKLLSSVKNEDTTSILKTVKGIAEEVGKKSKDVELTKGLFSGIQGLTTKVNDGNMLDVVSTKELSSNASKLVESLNSGIKSTIDNVNIGFRLNNEAFKETASKFKSLVVGDGEDGGTLNNILKSINENKESLTNVTDKFGNEATERSGIITNKIGTSVVGAFSDIKSVLSKNDSKAIEAGEELDGKINQYGIEAVIKAALLDYPIPETTDDSLRLYKRILNSIDPTGNYKKELNSDDEILKVVTKLHEESITDGRSSVLDAIGENSDGSKSFLSSLGGKAFNKLPTGMKNMLDNKFTDLTGNIKDRLKKAAVNTGKAMMPGLKDIGNDFKNAYRDPVTGKFKIAGVGTMAKLAGTTYFKGMHTAGQGIRELYPELFGVVKDTASYGIGKIGRSITGNKEVRHTNLELPIDAATYELWNNGKLTGEDVLKGLKTDEEKNAWTDWLEKRSEPGTSLTDILKVSGKVYFKSMVKSGPIVRKAYQNAASLALKAAKGVVKGFKTGGYSGDGGTDDLAGVVHKKEFILDNKRLTRLMDGVKYSNMDKVTEIAKSITDEVGNRSKEYANKAVDKTTTAVNSIPQTFMEKLNGTFYKLIGTTQNLVSKFDESNPNIILTPILSKLDKHLDDIIKARETETKNPFDKNGDGKRDGNSMERFAKLYGEKPKEDNKVKTVITRSEDKKCFGGTSCLTRMVALMAGGLVAYLGFKSNTMADVLSGIGSGIKGLWNGSIAAWDWSKDLLTSIRDGAVDSYYYIKSLPEAIGLNLREAFSGLPGVHAPSKSEWEHLKNSRHHDTPETIAKKKEIAIRKKLEQKDKITDSLKQEYIEHGLSQFDERQASVTDVENLTEEEKQTLTEQRNQYIQQLNEQWETTGKNSEFIQEKIATRMEQLPTNKSTTETTETKVDDSGGIFTIEHGVEAAIGGYAAKKVYNGGKRVVNAGTSIYKGTRRVKDILTGDITGRRREALESIKKRKYEEKVERKAAEKAERKAAGRAAKTTSSTIGRAATNTVESPGLFSRVWDATKNKATTFAKDAWETTKHRASYVADKAGTAWEATKKGVVKLGKFATDHLVPKKFLSLLKKIRGVLPKLAKKAAKHFGAKLAAKLMGKFAARFIPGLGQALLVFDLASIANLMLFSGLGLLSALSTYYLDFDLFSDEKDKDNTKDTVKGISKKDIEESKQPAIAKNKPINNYLPSVRKQVNNNIYTKPKTDDDSWTNAILGDAEKYSKITYKKVKAAIPKMAPGKLVSPDGGYDKLQLASGVDVNGLKDNMKDNLFSMANEYYSLTGKQIPINSAFRSYQYQQKLRSKLGSKAARPGHSTHEFGLAIDTNTSVANELDSLGLMRKYGFTRPIGKEGWHLEPAGVQEMLPRAKKETSLANALIDRGLGKGGGGWALVESAKKYSRNIPYQAEILSSTGNLVAKTKLAINSKTKLLKNKVKKYVDKTKGITLPNEITKTDIETKLKDSKRYVNNTFTNNKPTNIITDAENIGKKVIDKTKNTGSEVIDKIKTVNVNMPKLPETVVKLDPMIAVQHTTNSILDKSNNAMASMDEKLAALVELNSKLVKALLEKGTDVDIKAINVASTNTEQRPAYKRVMDSSLQNF